MLGVIKETGGVDLKPLYFHYHLFAKFDEETWSSQWQVTYTNLIIISNIYLEF